MSEYPECEKMSAVREKSQTIGLFLDSCKFTLCSWSSVHEAYLPTHISIEQLLADHFDIDLIKVEKERQHILDNL